MSRPLSRFRRAAAALAAAAAGHVLQDRRGTGAVEFALVAAPLVLMLVGTVEVARVVWTQTALERAAISGARCIGIRGVSCSRNGAYDETRAHAFLSREAGQWGVALAAQGIAVADNASCEGRAAHSVVRLTTDIFSPVPFVATMMAGSQTLTAEACFPTQADPAPG